jgi:hypothetical protein
MIPLIAKVDGMPVEYAISAIANLARVDPSMQAQKTLPFAAQVQTKDLGLVEARHLTEPAHEISAAGHGIID